MAEITRRRVGELQRGVIKILLDSPQGLPAKEVLQRLDNTFKKSWQLSIVRGPTFSSPIVGTSCTFRRISPGAQVSRPGSLDFSLFPLQPRPEAPAHSHPVLPCISVIQRFYFQQFPDSFAQWTTDGPYAKFACGVSAIFPQFIRTVPIK